MDKHSCQNCRYRGRSVLEEPCISGICQKFFSGCCYIWKPLKWHQKLWDTIKLKIGGIKNDSMRK